MYSFMIVSIRGTPRPNENRNIFISATSISVSCLCVSATVSNPYALQYCWSHCQVHLPLAGTRLSQITPDILLHPFHPACTLFFTSLPQSPLLCTVEHRLEILHFATSSPFIFTVPLTCLSFTHMYSVFILLTFVPLLSKPYVQLSSFSSICSLLSLQITMSSANIMVHGAFSLISSVILSITIANKQGLEADPWCHPPLHMSRTPPSLLPHTSLLLYCHHTYLVLFSRTSLPILTFSCNTTPLLLAPCHKLSPGPSDLL